MSMSVVDIFLIDDSIGKVLSVPFCPYHFVRTIVSNTILSVYHFVHTILSVPFCPLPLCPRTDIGPTEVLLHVTTNQVTFKWQDIKEQGQNLNLPSV